MPARMDVKAHFFLCFPRSRALHERTEDYAVLIAFADPDGSEMARFR
jgi:hypothetical protein